MKKQNLTKQEKLANVLEWLKFLALVLIVLPLCIFIFKGFSYAGLIVVCAGIVLFVFNLFLSYRLEQKGEKMENKKEEKLKEKAAQQEKQFKKKIKK